MIFCAIRPKEGKHGSPGEKFRQPRREIFNMPGNLRRRKAGKFPRAGNASYQSKCFKRFRKAVFIHFAADHIGAFFEFFASVAHTYADSGSFNHL